MAENWKCLGCGALNPQKRSKCWQCGSIVELIEVIRPSYVSIKPDGTSDTRYGDLGSIRPNPGAVLLTLETVDRAIRLVRVLKQNRRPAIDDQQVFAALIQLVESFVLHNEIFVVDMPLRYYMIEMEGYFPKEAFDLFRVFPKTLEVEDELVRLKLRDRNQDESKPIFVHPTDPAYQILSAAMAGIPYKPHPNAGEEIQRLLQQAADSYYSAFQTQTLQTVKDIASKDAEDMNRWLGQARFRIEVPLIFNHILMELKRKKRRDLDIIETALEVRISREATAFRKTCAEFDDAARQGEDRTLYRLKAEMQEVCDKLSARFQQPTLSIDIQFPPAIALNSLELWRFVQNLRKRHLVFIEHIYQSALRSQS